MNKLMTAAVLSMTAGLAMAQADCADKTGECEVIVKTIGDSPVGQVVRLSELSAPLAITTVGSQPEAAPKVKAETRMVMIQQDGDDEIKVEVVKGDVKAWINGDRVPKDRVKVGDEKITVLGKDGGVAAEFGFQPAGRFAFGEEQDGPIVWESQPKGEEGMRFFQPETDHPPVMIGINMGELGDDDVDDRLAEIMDERGLDADEVIRVLSVIDGLPADEAGLRDGDVIVRVDGKWGIGVDKLRSVLADKEPGDQIELAVVRDGRFREIEVELAPWDAQQLGVMSFELELEDQGDGPKVYQWRSGDENQKLLLELRERLGDLGGENAELHEHLLELFKGLEGNERLERFQFDVMPRIQRFRPEGEDVERWLVQPAPRPGAVPDLEARLERMEDRLERLESRLDRLLDVLEERRQD